MLFKQVGLAVASAPRHKGHDAEPLYMFAILIIILVYIYIYIYIWRMLVLAGIIRICILLYIYFILKKVYSFSGCSGCGISPAACGARREAAIYVYNQNRYTSVYISI